MAELRPHAPRGIRGIAGWSGRRHGKSGKAGRGQDLAGMVSNSNVYKGCSPDLTGPRYFGAVRNVLDFLEIIA